MPWTTLGTTFVIVVLGTGLLVDAERDLPQDLKDEIWSHKGAVDKIVNYILNGNAKGQAFNRLVNFTDTYGDRLISTPELENSIDGLKSWLEEDQLHNVAKEMVTGAPHWIRGYEVAKITKPYERRMSIMSSGSSIGTQDMQNGRILAPAIVVKTEEQLNSIPIENVRGKIVVFNQDWVDYSTSVVYRSRGAVFAAKKEAVAVLVRSVTDFSLYTPHTGVQNYNESVPQIPSACITVEDAELLQRYNDTGEEIEIEIYMEAVHYGYNATSYNLVAEIEGAEHKDESVIFGGHIDSWDVGRGVMDDAGGVIISWQALSVVNALMKDGSIDRPTRTMRAVMWTSEEHGLHGAIQYYEAHKNEKVSLIMESDAGTFAPLGVGFTGCGLARAIMEEIMEMLNEIGTTKVRPDGSSPDTDIWKDAGFPVANLYNQNENYYLYHHTHADTITMQDPDDYELCAVVWTVSSYVVAMLEDMLPLEGDYPESSRAQPLLIPSVTMLVFIQVLIFLSKITIL